MGDELSPIFHRGIDRRTFLKRAAGAAGFIGALSAGRWYDALLHAAAPSGTITIVQGVDVETLHPHVTTSNASKGPMWALHDRLFERDPGMNVIPGLAESFRLINDTTWELHLRKNVFFHNG